jgi:hypothetical protein
MQDLHAGCRVRVAMTRAQQFNGGGNSAAGQLCVGTGPAL